MRFLIEKFDESDEIDMIWKVAKTTGDIDQKIQQLTLERKKFDTNRKVVDEINKVLQWLGDLKYDEKKDFVTKQDIENKWGNK